MASLDVVVLDEQVEAEATAVRGEERLHLRAVLRVTVGVDGVQTHQCLERATRFRVTTK